MKEFTAILEARKFIRNANIESIPVDIEKCAKAANAKIKITNDLEEEESGNTFKLGKQNIILVNGTHNEQRQRFTVLHEIAHIIQKIPSKHHGPNLSSSDLISYRSRPKEEILCDVFAAECLLPSEFFRNDMDDLDISLDAVKELADKYKASLTSTGSRFASNCDTPCAFVLMEQGKIRYVSRSRSLKELNGWIQFGIPIPNGSVAYYLLTENKTVQDCDEIPTDTWFSNGIGSHQYLSEEAMLINRWNQCLSLIWFDQDIDDDDTLLEELSGIPQWR